MKFFFKDVRIHLLREIRRTVSDLLFSAVESKPEVAAKLQQLFDEVIYIIQNVKLIYNFYYFIRILIIKYVSYS